VVEIIYFFVIATVAIGLGLRILRGRGLAFDSLAEELAFSFGLGIGALALGIMILGMAHLLYESSLYVLLLLFGIAGCKELVGVTGRFRGRVPQWYVPFGSFYFWLAALMIVGILLNLTRALTPAFGAVDPLVYHLALPKIYLKKHFLSFESSITGALYPANISMLFALGIGLRNATLAQLIHFSMGVGCLFFIVAFCRRYFDVKVGLWAAAIFSFTPVLVFFGPLGYVDIGLCFFQFLAFWALFNWLERPDERMLLLSGIFTGLSLGTKHPALPMWFVGVGIIAVASLYRREPFKDLIRHCALFGGVALVLVAPWYVRSYVEAGNPVWPLANELFGGNPHRGISRVGFASAGLQSAASSFLPSVERLKNLLYWCALSLWEWTWNLRLGWQKAIGVYFVAFLPGLLVYYRNRRVLLLTGFCFLYYLIVVLRVDGNPRYSLFLFAFLSIIAGYVGEQMLSGGMGRVRLRGLISVRLLFCITLVCNIGQNYALGQTNLDFLFSGKSREQFLVENEGNYRAFQHVNHHLPKSAVVLLQGIVKGYYCDRNYIWDHPYQRVINYRDYDTSEKLMRRMQELGISHVVRMIRIPSFRISIGYPQYFLDPFHETFRKNYLRLIYRDESYALFEVKYPQRFSSY